MDPQLDDRKIFVDELNQIRLVNPILTDSAAKFAREGREFTGQFGQFLESVADLRETMEKVGGLTDRERLKVLSLLSQLEDQRGDAEETQQLKILINERQKELERLNVELGYMRTIEEQQNEYLMVCKKI